jgi:hypothetical protein
VALTVAIDWDDLSLVLVGPKDEWVMSEVATTNSPSGHNKPRKRVAFGAMTKILLSRFSPKTLSFLGTGMLGRCENFTVCFGGKFRRAG